MTRRQTATRRVRGRTSSWLGSSSYRLQDSSGSLSILREAGFVNVTVTGKSGDGAPPVELIDGERLCDLLKDYGLGVVVKQRVEEDVVVQPDLFNEYE
jgi:hypothetical protein